MRPRSPPGGSAPVVELVRRVEALRAVGDRRDARAGDAVARIVAEEIDIAREVALLGVHRAQQLQRRARVVDGAVGVARCERVGLHRVGKTVGIGTAVLVDRHRVKEFCPAQRAGETVGVEQVIEENEVELGVVGAHERPPARRERVREGALFDKSLNQT